MQQTINSKPVESIIDDNQLRPIIKQLHSNQKTIKIDTRVWVALRSMKKENETFNDIIKGLINQRTVSSEKGQISLINYSRKSSFVEVGYNYKNIGIEFEYNDVKTQQMNFTLDIKINKIFFGKQRFNPSIFFGVDSMHKHLNKVYLNLYLKCISLALEKEFRASNRMYSDKDFEDISRWRKLYYDYNLSEDSFIRDIEDSLKLSEEEKPDEKIKQSIKKSVSASIWKDII